MHFSKLDVLRRHRPNLLRYRLDFLRSMGGGPRTFPGGLNKWQWKRMHEKKAREKEKRLLQQEKQIYEARVRSQIRAKLENPESDSVRNGESYSPMSPEEHVKALADRFMKEGAEDLWNENDGPVEGPVNKPGRGLTFDGKIDLRKSVGDRGVRNGEVLSGVGTHLGKVRHFSTNARFSCRENVVKREFLSNVGDVRRFSTYREFSPRGGLMSGFGSYELRRTCFLSCFLDLKRDYSVGADRDRSGRLSSSKNSGSGLKVGSSGGNRATWPKFRGREMGSSDDTDGDEDEEGESGRILGSSAALGKHDVKTSKRVPLKFLEAEDAFSRQVEDIRRELNERKLKENSENKNVMEESILSTKRFDECGVNALTVQALTESGYVQMNRVQETTLSVSFEGKDALVKSKSGMGKSIAFLF